MRWFAVPLMIVASLLLVACASPDAGRNTSARMPASQESVRNEARSRAKAHTDLGFEYFAQNQLGTALQEAKVALKDDSGYTPAYNLLALVNMSLGENKAAEEAFQRALQLSPGDPEISNNYGWYLCQNKREREAFTYFDTALRNPLYQTPIVALANTAECATQIDQFAQGEAAAKRALELNPDYARVLFIMANLKYKQHQYDAARYYVGEVHRVVAPSAATAWLALRIARQTGNREDEARYMSLLKKKFPDSNEYRLMSEGKPE